MRVELPYGTHTYPIDLSGRQVEVLAPPALGVPPPLPSLLEAALDRAPLTVPPGARITLIVSDATRNEPRAAFIEVLRARLPAVRWTLAIATGTHGPAALDALALPSDFLGEATIVNHDGHAQTDLVELGTTSRGTPVRIHRCVIDSDLIIATGCIRPHYFAGFGAGAKAIFPGLGEAVAIRTNHRLKTAPGSRAGIVVGNPCRDDLEEAVLLVPTRAFLLNGVCDPDDHIRDVVAGDIIDAFRAGAAIATPWYRVHARPAPLVIASDALPVTASLYQAAKIAAAMAPLVAEGGTLALVAECAEGIGPIDTVNEAIFRIGVLPRLAPAVRLVLVSSLSEAETAQTLLAYGGSVDQVVESVAADRILVVPHASKLLVEAT